MKNRKYSIKGGLSTAKLLWPEFKVVDDLVFFSWCAPDSIDFSRWHDRTEAESFFNHIHILDCFSHNAGISEEPWWNTEHSDFKHACEFGRILAETIASKLKKEFPNRNFYVYYTEQDNPIVRFHQRHPDEVALISSENWKNEIECKQVVIHTV